MSARVSAAHQALIRPALNEPDAWNPYLPPPVPETRPSACP
jgi:hypothetical protein